MLSVVTWKWGTAYGHQYVNRLRSMLERNLSIPHRLYCITDDETGIDTRVYTLPMYTEYAGIKKAQGYRSADNDLCQRRLKMFDHGMAGVLGSRILHVDLDTVITGDITPLVQRDEPLVMYGHPQRQSGVMPGLMLFDAGYLHGLWAEFKGNSPRSDMELIESYVKANKLNPAQWRVEQGAYSYLWINKKNGGVLPEDARIVLFYGPVNPHAAPEAWVKEHWR